MKLRNDDETKEKQMLICECYEWHQICEFVNALDKNRSLFFFSFPKTSRNHVLVFCSGSAKLLLFGFGWLSDQFLYLILFIRNNFFYTFQSGSKPCCQ